MSGKPGGGGGGGDKRAGGSAGGSGDAGRKKKDTIMTELAKFIDKRVLVKFQGGREAEGVLKGYDALINLVLDDALEYLRDPDDPYKVTNHTRRLGLIVCRGTTLTVVMPTNGREPIANPFVQHD